MTLEDYDLHFKPMLQDYFYSLRPIGDEHNDDVMYIKLTDAIDLCEFLLKRIRLVKNMESNLSSVKICIEHAKEFLDCLSDDLDTDK